MSDPKTALTDALAKEPRPVTDARVQEIAAQVLSGVEAGEFAKWYEKHSADLLGRLNA